MKKELRTRIRSLKGTFTAEQLSEMSSSITTRLLTNPLYMRATTILLYHSLPDEVCTHTLISKAYNQGKRVLLPTVVGSELELHEYTPSAGTHQGSFSIIESDGPLFTDYPSIDLAIIPGMAFDSEGNRLGRGKGYYDRLLPRLHCPLIGLCFPFQFVESIPVEPHDRKVDVVLY